MSEPLRAPGPEDPRDDATEVARAAATDESRDFGMEELRARAREKAEAEAAVDAVMRREAHKAQKLAQIESRQRPKPQPLRVLALLALLAANVYLWAGQPEWLTWHEPPAPSIDYYQNSYKVAVWLQRQRIEEYRHEKRELPKVARQAGPPVRGVRYTPLAPDVYMLEAGKGLRMVVYTSRDSIAAFMGRTLIQVGLAAQGVR